MKRTLISALVASVVAIAGGCDNAQQRTDKYISQGTSYLEKADYDKARISFKNALQIDPKNIDARLKFAETLERSGDMKGAYGQYAAVLEADPNNAMALEKQGKLLLMAREVDLALANAEKLLQIKGDKYVPALTLKAGALTLQDKVSDAIALAEHAATLDATNLDNSILLGSLYMRQADFARAEASLKRAAQAHASVTGLKIALAETLRKQGKHAEVEAILRELQQEAPDELAHAMELSRHLKNTGKPDDALQVMQSFVKTHADNVNAKLAYVQLTDVAKNTAEGDALLAEFIRGEPTTYRLQFAQIERLVAGKKQDEAIKMLEKIVASEKTGNDAITARMMLARHRVAQKDVAAAKLLIDEVLALNPSDLDALALRGRIAVVEKRFVDAIGDLRAVVKERLDDVASVELLASAHVQNNEVDLADELLQRTMKFYPSNIKLKLMLAEIKARKGDRDGAIAQYRAVLEKTPDNTAALLELAKLYQAANDNAGLAEIADRMLADQKTMPTGFYYQGLIRQSEGKFADAHELFEKSLTLAPDAVEPMTAVVKNYIAQKQPAQAVAWVDARIKQKPNHATLHNLKAEAQMVRNDAVGAEKSLNEAIKNSPAWWTPYRTLSALQLLRDDTSAAQKTLEQGIAATNKNPMLRMELALLFGRMGKNDDAIAVYRQMIDEGLSGDAVINNLTMLLSTKDDEKSRTEIKNFSERLAQTSNPIYLDTAGWVHYQLGDYQAALPILKKAVELAPKHPVLRYHLGVAYFKNNQLPQAKENLELALEAKGEFEGKEEAQQVLEQLQKS